MCGLPLDVRKGSAFPARINNLSEAAPPHRRGIASPIFNSRKVYGKAKPFRTSGGKATPNSV
jgi:hypothetical protein